MTYIEIFILGISAGFGTGIILAFVALPVSIFHALMNKAVTDE